jgi:MOSC domain-containing protein YiiM
MTTLLDLRLGPVRTVAGLTSAIFKEAAAGPVRVTTLGLEGDEVADRKAHGGPDQALLGLCVAHYADWATEGHAFAVGSFGENLVLDGLNEDEACIGDVLRIGGVELQIAHPRVPCGTLQRRLAAPVLQRVWETARGGYYLRVLVPGELRAGLEVELRHRPNPGWTVKRALHLQWHPKADPDATLALASLPELSAHWRERLPRQARGEG